jgi:flagella basal body P-ring formation protein FlgA
VDHALDLVLAAALLLGALLWLRATGHLSRLPAPWGLTRQVPVAARALHRGEELAPADTTRIWANPDAGEIVEAREIASTVLRAGRDLPAGSPLARQDFELTATRDVAPGAALAAADVALAWSAYDRGALVDPRTAVGRRALRALPKGSVVRRSDLAPPPPP